MANGIHTELTFESAIEASLLEFDGYNKGLSKNFDALGLSSAKYN
jgi:type I restriction enzyme R subunit